jgi:TonB family protein
MAMALLVLLTAAVHKVEKQKYIEHMVFMELTPPPPPPKVVIPKVKVFAPPQPEVVKLEPPKIVIPKIQPPPEIPKPVKLDVPDQPKLPPAPPKAVAPPPQPKVGLFASAKPTEVANNKEAPTAKAGGFGDPIGAKPNPNSSNSQLVAEGTFNNAPGANTGAGAARKGAVSGTSFGAGVTNGVPGGHDMGKVASAGFANGVAGSRGKPGGTGTVATAGFATDTSAPTQVAIKTGEPAFLAPVVISEPHPGYTAEAARLKIQGEVTLQVRFTAAGRVEILRVVNGLGHGLDESAERVAEGIQFRPAVKDGHPVDHTTLIHVTFQLADAPDIAQRSKPSKLPDGGKHPSTQRLERYPLLDCPDEVLPDREFAVQVSLTEKLVTPNVHVDQGEATPEGKIAMTLPDNQEKSWDLDVVLAAPELQFTRSGTNIGSIQLPLQGDATSAVFYVRAKPNAVAGGTIHVLASYWYKGRYLARISRELRVVRVEPVVVSAALVTRRDVKYHGAVDDTPAEFAEDNVQPDLTLVISGDGITLSSRYLQPTTGKLKDSAGFAHWLTQNSQNLAQAGRGATRVASSNGPNKALAEGFGMLLYENYAPDIFKKAFWTLHDKLHDRFRTIQIYSDDPQIPWELMRPVRDDGTDQQTFLGLSHSIARWHVTNGVSPFSCFDVLARYSLQQIYFQKNSAHFGLGGVQQSGEPA